MNKGICCRVHMHCLRSTISEVSLLSGCSVHSNEFEGLASLSGEETDTRLSTGLRTPLSGTELFLGCASKWGQV